MSKQSVYLDELYPLEAFKLLAAAAERDQGNALAEVELIFPSDSIFILSTLVTLKVPDPYTETKPQPGEADRIRVFDELITAYRQIKGGEPGHKAPFEEPVSLSLGEGLCRLLLLTRERDHEKPALVKEDEYLVVGRDMDKEDARGIFERLSIHATYTRISGAETRLGSRYLFYVKDDHRRRSSFLSLAAGDAFSGCQVLQAYHSGDFTIFLPPEAGPGAVELDYFCRIILNTPLLWGTGKEKANNGLLAAVIQWPGPKGLTTKKEINIEFFYLAGLRFYNQSAFTQPEPGHLTFELLDLKSSEKSADTLKVEFRAAEPHVGYRLELRSTRHLDQDKVEHLYEEKARIEYQIAYKESISRPRPVLLRFTQRQLPALADVIRSFPMKVIHDGDLKYGFQATPYEPTGFHFILVDPWEAARSSLDPIPLWGDLDPRPMRFRLDPFWARYYHDQAGTALVFVPEGTALFPPMHDWDRRSMDRYLRETMQQWFDSQKEAANIPEHPIYIFDGEPRPSAEIRISVLDQESLKPLHTRLDWLNDNLTVTHAVGIEELISRMARGVTWQELYQKIIEDVEKIQEDFEETAAASSQQMAAAIHEMTESLTEEINRVVEKTFQMAMEVKKLDEELREWETVCTGMRAFLNEVNKTQKNTIQQTVKAQNEFYNMVRQIDYEISTSQRNREKIEKKISNEIIKLKESYRKLREKLFSFKLW
jgi:GTPase SAR1 family protein